MHEFRFSTTHGKTRKSPSGSTAAIYRLERLEDVAAPTNISLSVAFVSQRTGQSNYLCQYACGAMLAGQAWGSNFATTAQMHDLARIAKGSTNPTTLSTANDAAYALNRIVPNNVTTRATVLYGNFDSIKNELIAGRAVSLSIKYSELGSYRAVTSWSGAHQIVVVGFNETRGEWTYMDPLAQTNGRKTVPSATFRNAVKNLSWNVNGQTYNQSQSFGYLVIK